MHLIWDKFWPSILYGNYKRAENRTSPDANPKPVEFYCVEAFANGLLLPDGTLQEMAVPTFLLRKAGVRLVDPEGERRPEDLVRPGSLKLFHFSQTMERYVSKYVLRYVSRDLFNVIGKIVLPMLLCVLLSALASDRFDTYFGDFADSVLRIAIIICLFFIIVRPRFLLCLSLLRSRP